VASSHTEVVCLAKLITHTSIDHTRHRVTLFIKTNALSLSHDATYSQIKTLQTHSHHTNWTECNSTGCGKKRIQCSPVPFSSTQLVRCEQVLKLRQIMIIWCTNVQDLYVVYGSSISRTANSTISFTGRMRLSGYGSTLYSSEVRQFFISDGQGEMSNFSVPASNTNKTVLQQQSVK